MTKKEKHTEELIFDAAVQVFEEKGLDGARMQEIADRAGINKALLHYYFRSKGKLFDAVFDKLAGVMFKKLFACFDNDLPFEEKLRLFYREHIGFLQMHPRLPAFLLNEINKHPQRVAAIFSSERVTEMRQSLFKQIDEDIEKGVIKDIDKMQLMINVIALSVFPFAARGLIEIILQQHNIDFEEFVEQRKTELPKFIINAVKTK